MLLRFLQAAIEVEVDWALDSVAAIRAAGDVYEAQRRLLAAKKRLEGILRFDVFAEAPLLELGAPELAAEIRAGEAFHRILLGELGEDELKLAIRRFPKRHRGTVYATAIGKAADGGKPFQHFLEQNSTLEKYDYPPRGLSK